jgi:hypothetical protein
MNITRAVYVRTVEHIGGGVSEQPIELAAECFQAGDDVTVIWTDECLARLAALDLDGEELIGCTETIEEKFFQDEREYCRVMKVKQAMGTVAA